MPLYLAEPMEQRTLLSAIIDVRLPGGGKLVDAVAVDQVVDMEVWAIITGDNELGEDDGVQSVIGSFLSTDVGGGAARGSLIAWRNAPFDTIGSFSGTRVDLDGDGDLDVGDNSDTGTGLFAARAGGMITTGGVISGPSQSYQVGTLRFRLTELLAGTETEINFRPSLKWGAVWTEDGVVHIPENGELRAGLPVVIRPVQAPGTVRFTTVRQSAVEHGGTAQITAELPAPAGADVIVPFTLGGTAVQGTDYAITASPIVIPAGSLTGSATITLTNDALTEMNETVIVTMGTPVNAVAAGITEHTITIVDNDRPTVQFTSAAQSGDEKIGTMTITAQLSAPWEKDVTVPFTVGGTAAGGGADYNIIGREVVIPAGSTSASIIVTIMQDTFTEVDETVIVTMGTPTNAVASETTVHTATIFDSNRPVTVQFTQVSQMANEDGGPVTITAELSRVWWQDVSIPLILGGSATQGADYTLGSNPLVIPAGALTASSTLTFINDDLNEGTESLNVTMGTPLHATASGVTSHTLTIGDMDDVPPTVQFTQATQSVAENGGPVTITVQLSTAWRQEVMVPYTLSGWAVNGTDYSISPNPVVIPIGSTSGTITVTLLDDAIAEMDETIVVTMGTPTNAMASGVTQHTVTILDDEPPNYALSFDGVNDRAILGDAADSSLNFGASATLEAWVKFDSLLYGVDSWFIHKDGNDRWRLVYGAGSERLEFQWGSGMSADSTVRSDTWIPTIGQWYHVALVKSLNRYTLYRDGIEVVARDITNPFRDAGGTLLLGDSFNRLHGELDEVRMWNIARTPEQLRATMSTWLTGNETGLVGYWNFNEPLASQEVRNLAPLGSPGTLGDDAAVEAADPLRVFSSAPVVAPLLVQLTSAGQTVDEAGGAVTLTARLSATTANIVTVPLLLAGTAANGADYTIASTSITIPAGSTTGAITINITDDLLDEADETIIVTLGTPTNAMLGNTTVCTVTILDNDPAPTVSFTSAGQSVNERIGTATISVQLSAASGQDVTVPLVLEGASTSDGDDYIVALGPLVIPAGTTTASRIVTIMDDWQVESDETVVLTLGTPINAVLGAVPQHVLTILENDYWLTIGDASATEGDSGRKELVFPVVRHGGVTDEVNVPYATEDISATLGSDYEAGDGRLIIAAGESAGAIRIPILGDNAYEAEEQFKLMLPAGGEGEFAMVRSGFNSPGYYPKPYAVALGDLNGDGLPDMVAGNLRLATVSVFFNTTPKGASVPTFAAGRLFGTQLDPHDVAIRDLNGDGRPEIVVVERSRGVTILVNQTPPLLDTPMFAPFQAFNFGAGPIHVSLSDLNADGRADLIVSNGNADTISTALNDTPPGSATLRFVRADWPVGENPMATAVGDVNGDGRPDIAVANSGPDTVSVLLNTTHPGSTALSFAAKTDFAAGLDTSFPVLVDLNGDYRLDIASVNNQSSSVTVMLNTTPAGATSPSFSPGQQFAVRAGPSSMVSGDLDADGRPDLAITSLNTSTVSVLLNRTEDGASAPFFLAARELATLAHPERLAVADLNRDGMPDLAVGHFDDDAVATFTHAPRVAIGTIVNDDDPQVNFSLAASTAPETAGTVTVTAELQAVWPQDVTVPFTLGGTAVLGEDYTVPATSMLIPAGSTSVSVTITIVDDAMDEPDETIILTMGTPVNAARGDVAEHTITLNDDDAPPTVHFTQAAQGAAENAGTISITAELSAVSGLDVSVPFNLSGTATNGTDYTVAPDPILIPAGATSASITINLLDDGVIEPDETVIVTMDTPVNATAEGVTVHTATIADNDVIIISAPNVSVGGSSTSLVTGFFDITFDVPANRIENLAGYNLVLALDPGGAGVRFTGAAEAADAVFTGQSPIVFGTGDRLLVADALPGIGEAKPIVDGAGLIRVLFEAQAGVIGTFGVKVETLELYDANASAIPGLRLVNGRIDVVDTTPPAVRDVRLGVNNPAAPLLYGSGYAVPVGSPAQAAPLPWFGLNQLSIAFSEPVTVRQEDLSLRGLNVASYAFSGFTYNSSTSTATWTLASPIAKDKLLIDLSDGIADIVGNRLDGEWIDSVDTYPSGDGSAGGDFKFRVNVLQGDANQGATVGVSDVLLVRNAQFTAPGNPAYSVFYDVNGSNSIAINDVLLVRNNQFTALPSGEPLSATILRQPLGSAAAATGGVTATVQNAEITASPGGPVNGFVDVVLSVPDGASPLLAGYETSVLLTPPGSGVVLTGVAVASSPVFPGQTPLVFNSTGGRLDVADNLPGIRQETAILNGSGLFRIKFQVQSGAAGTFNINLSGLQLFDGLVQPVTVDQVIGGTMTVTNPDVPLALVGDAQDDMFHLRLSPSGSDLHIWHNAPTSSAPTQTVPVGTFTRIAIDTDAGSDLLVIDRSAGDPLPAGGLAYDGGAGADRANVIGTPDAETFVADHAQLRVNTTTISLVGVEGIDLNGGGGNDDVSIGGLASATLASGQTLADLSITDSARVDVVVGGGLLRVATLTVGPAAVLDLSDNDLVVQATAGARASVLDMLTSRVASAHGNTEPLWRGSGITSSIAAVSSLKGLAVALNETASAGPLRWPGEDRYAVLVKHTWNGDANLDGTVNALDYFWIDSGFLAGSKDWIMGDFNYDKVVNALDYFLIDSAFLGQSGALSGPLSVQGSPTAKSSRGVGRELFSQRRILQKRRKPRILRQRLA